MEFYSEKMNASRTFFISLPTNEKKIDIIKDKTIEGYIK